MHRWLFAILILVFLSLCYIAGAEDKTVYILCDPAVTNHVNIRRSPRKDAEEIGRLDCGDSFVTDGKVKNGYMHVIGMTEYGEGWVNKGYVVTDKPVIEDCNATVAATGRVKTRWNVNGRKRGWLDVCTDIKIFAHSSEWAVTSEGYVQMKYLELWE